MDSEKLRELTEQFRKVLSGRGNLIDSILPPLLFVLLNAIWRFEIAMWGSLGLALILTAMRLIRRQQVGYALGGVGAVVLAILVARFLGRAEGYFLPNIITGALTALACLVSVITRRPLVAWTSHFARRWPQEWYWHPRVRPAYSEVTLAWGLLFALRLALQIFLFREQAAGALAVIQFATGWPLTIVLLAASYLYGTWRLRQLEGPSVEEFKNDTPPPWEGQQQGF